MKLTKQQREQIKQMYNGRCSYCGEELNGSFVVDHILPVVRDDREPSGMLHPERDVIENLTPSCRSCNHIKSSASLESFRLYIQRFINSLNRDSVQYKFAKRYGLVQETEIPVVFYFETFTNKKSEGC